MSWRRLSGVAAAMALLIGLSGCASVSQWFSNDDPTTPQDAPVPTVPVYRLDIDAPSDVRGLLKEYLDLSRYQNAPQGDEVTSLEIDRLMSAAPAQVRSLLQTEGYFSPQVKVSRDGSSAPDPTVPAASGASAPANGKRAGDLPLLKLQVDPGPQTRVSQFDFNAQGPLQQLALAGDLQARVLMAQVRNEWKLPPDFAFTQSDWTSAKNVALAKLRADGYPSATWGKTSATVDEATRTAVLELTADSGDLYRIGPLEIEGLEHFGESAVRNLWTAQLGEPYRESDLMDFQERVQRAGLFEGASVALDSNPDTSQAAPVQVRVRELMLQQATFGVGVSADTGPRLSGEYIHRQPFGFEWIAKNTLELGGKRKFWSGELTSYPLEGLHRHLISANVERLDTVDEVRDSSVVRVGVSQDLPRTERLAFVEFTHAQLEAGSDTGTVTSNSDAISANLNWIYRDLDSVLLPTKGNTLATQTALGYALSRKDDTGTDANGPFARLYARYTRYEPLGAAWYGTVRVEAGQILAADSVGIPDTLLFRAGGEDSVRGYAYRSLGPTVDGALLSGRALLTGSVEVARPISARYPSVWWAAFVDAGNAADNWRDMDPVLGYGLGLRWRSPVGPLRLDMAYGQEVQAWRMHLSVGIAF
jgi:translocation and assembly module TamA